MVKSAVFPAFALLTACMAQQPLRNNAYDERELNAELAGLVAGPPQQCLPGFRTQDMQAIGVNTILTRQGNTIYRSDTSGSCSMAGRMGTTLLLKKVGTNTSCRGDIVQVVDLQTGSFFGSCSFGDFVPYRRP